MLVSASSSLISSCCRGWFWERNIHLPRTLSEHTPEVRSFAENAGFGLGLWLGFAAEATQVFAEMLMDVIQMLERCGNSGFSENTPTQG
jgi:hypothetical protein